MSLKTILLRGDDTLLKTSKPVTRFDRKLHNLLDDMLETMQNADGAGLAAPQLGILRRVVLVLDENWEPFELVNPEIVETSGEQYGPEGCLSIPGYYGLVSRPSHVKVRAFDRYGKPFEAEGSGLTARAFCHEIDHLDGRLYTDLTEKLMTPEELDEYYKSHPEDGEAQAEEKSDGEKI